MPLERNPGYCEVVAMVTTPGEWQRGGWWLGGSGSPLGAGGEWTCPGSMEGLGLSGTSDMARRLAARPAPPRSRAANGLGEAPPFPVRSATRRRAQRRARDLDAEDFAGVSDHEVANPFGQGRATPQHGVVDIQRLLERAPFGVREAHEDSLLAGMRDRRPPPGCHVISDITIS